MKTLLRVKPNKCGYLSAFLKQKSALYAHIDDSYSRTGVGDKLDLCHVIVYFFSRDAVSFRPSSKEVTLQFLELFRKHKNVRFIRALLCIVSLLKYLVINRSFATEKIGFENCR